MARPVDWLHIDALHFAYPSGAGVLANWSAHIPPGLTVICGDEGCGKTSLLRLLAGELTGTGTLTLAGAPVDPAQVFWQDPRAAPDATIASAYLSAQAARWPGWNEAAVQAHIDGLGLREHLHKPMLALSTGGRRKLWQAAALASGALLTLIDEPLAALDTPSIRYLLSALAQVGAQRDRWTLVAHWDALPDLPDAHTVHLR